MSEPPVFNPDHSAGGQRLELLGDPSTPVRPPGHGHALSETEVHLIDYVKVLYKRRWAAINSFALIVGLTALYTFTATLMFRARVQLLIEPENPNVVSFKEVVDPQKNTIDYYQTQYNILQSRALARRTIEAIQAWHHPALTGTVGVASTLGLGATAKSPSDGAPTELPEQAPIIDRFLGGLTISAVRNSRLVNVDYVSSDPRFATDVLNALKRAYIEQILEFKFRHRKRRPTGSVRSWRCSARRSKTARWRYSAIASRTMRSRWKTGRTSLFRSSRIST